MRLHVNMRLHVHLHLHVHMHLHVRMRPHVRLDLSSSCNQRTRSGCRARFVGYERLEDMNDCRFLHYWKLNISPGKYMYRNGGCERTVHSLQFLPGKSFTASNRSYPAKMPRCRAQAPVPRRARARPGPGTANPDNKKGRTGVSNPVRPPTCAFSCCSHTRQNQQARSSRTAATNPTTRADAMLQSRLKPMWPTEPQSRSAPGPALAGPAGPHPASP